MRTAILPILMVFSIAYSQGDSTESAIRQVYNSTKAGLLKFISDTVDVQGLSTEGAKLICYRDSRKSIRLMVLRVQGEVGQTYEEYLFSGKTLLFVFQKLEQYNAPHGLTQEKARETGIDLFDPAKSRFIENRCYFKNGAMVVWLNGTTRHVRGTSGDFLKVEKDKLQIADKLLSKCK